MNNGNNSDKPYVLGRTQMAGALLVISDRSNKLYESAVNYHNVGELSISAIKAKLHEIQSYLGAVYEMVEEYELNSSGNTTETYKPDNVENSPFLHNTPESDISAQLLHQAESDTPIKSGKWRDGYYSNEPYNLDESDILDEEAKLREEDFLARNTAVRDESDMSPEMAQVVQNIEKLNQAVEDDKTDKTDDSGIRYMTDSGKRFSAPSEKGSVKNLRAVRANGTFVEKGETVSSGPESDDKWEFVSITHPRKINVMWKNDPNGSDSWPNVQSMSYYASVLNLGIWDVQFKEWTFRPDGDKKDIEVIEHNLRNLDFEH